MTSAPPSMKTSMPIARIDSTDERCVWLEANSAISDSRGSARTCRCPSNNPPTAPPSATSMTRPLTIVTPPTASTANSTTEATLIGASLRTVAESTFKGMISAATARARQTLATIDPTRLPMAKSGDLAAATPATMSSAILVPRPPTSAAATVGRTRIEAEMRARAITNWSPLMASTMRLPTSPTRSSHRGAVEGTRNASMVPTRLPGAPLWGCITRSYCQLQGDDRRLSRSGVWPKPCGLHRCANHDDQSRSGQPP